MKPVQTPDMSKALQDFFRLVGRVRLNVDEVIVPVVNVGDLGLSQTPPTVRAATGRIGNAAVVGQRFWGAIKVPRGVGCKITQIRVYSRAGAAFTLDFYWAEGDPGVGLTAGDSNFTDGRLSGNLISNNAVELQEGTVAGAPATQATGSILIDGSVQTYLYPEHWVLGSRSGDSYLSLVSGSTNVECRIDVDWIEFDLPGE